jgi:hypothetical protein
MTRCPQCGRGLPIPSGKDRVQADVPPERERPAESLRSERPQWERRPDGDRDDGLRAAPPTSRKAIAALILGILSVIGFTLITGLPAIILGILGLRDARRGKAGGKGLAIAGLVLGALGTCVAAPVLGLVYAVHSVREHVAQLQSKNNLHQMMLGMHDYATGNDHFPAYAIMDPKDRSKPKPLLSWRVALLPYLEQDNLYNAFKLDEPWDGPNNSRLISVMPKVYQNPRFKAAPGYTNYRVFVSNKPSSAAALDPNPMDPLIGPRLPVDFPDGTPNTIVVVEADEAVPWTKPDELPFDPDGPVSGVGSFMRGGPIVVGLADGTVRMIDVKTFSPATLKAAITRNGGEPMGPDW